MSRLLRSRRGHAPEGEEEHGTSDDYSTNTNDFSESDSEEYTDDSSEDYTDSDDQDTSDYEDETEEEEEESDTEEDQSQSSAPSQQQEPVALTTEDTQTSADQPSTDPVGSSPMPEEVISYQACHDDKEKRIQEQREYRRKLVEDPSFVPYVGSFWGHDDRYREDLLTETRAEGSQPHFSSNSNNSNSRINNASRGYDGHRYDAHLDPLMYKKWDHSGYEELLRMDEEDERRKRSLIEAGKTEELANFRPYRPRYYNNDTRGPRNFRTNEAERGYQRGPQRQQQRQRSQQDEWPELSNASQSKTGEDDKQPEAPANMEQSNTWTQSTASLTDGHGWGDADVKEDKAEESGWGDADVKEAKTEESGWGEASATHESNSWERASSVQDNSGWDEPSSLLPSKQSNWENSEEQAAPIANQWDPNSWSASKGQTVTDDITEDRSNNMKFTDSKENWNNDNRLQSDKRRRNRTDIPIEEKASSSWTTNAVPEIEVPTTPSKWTIRNDRGKGRFNSNSTYHSTSGTSYHNDGSSSKPDEAQSGKPMVQEWNSNSWGSSAATKPADTPTDSWAEPEASTKTENGWGQQPIIADVSENNNGSMNASDSWDTPNTVVANSDWKSALPDSEKAASTDETKDSSAGWGVKSQSSIADADAKGPESDLGYSNVGWDTAEKAPVEDSQNTRSESTTAGWDEPDASKQSEVIYAKWGQESYEPNQDQKGHKHNDHEGKYNDRNTTSYPPRRGRGYLSQKIESIAVTTTSNTTPSSVSEEDQMSSQHQISQEATPVMSAWGNFHNTGDEDSDVEIILEAEEEPEWLKQEQVLGMTSPGDMDTSSQSPHVFSSSSVDGSPNKHASHQHYYQVDRSPRFDSRKPRYNSNNNKPRRQFDENWRRRKDDSHQPQPLQQQPIPVYYPPPQHMNGANIAYVPMIPNANYFHMGGNIQPTDSAAAAPNKFYGPLPPGFEANGMVYYGVDPNLYPPVQPFYYYVPMANNNGASGSSLAYEEPRRPPSQQLHEEDEDEGWGPSPEIGDVDSQWKSHNNRHQQNSASHNVNYNHPSYYYYPQQPQNHF